MSQYRSTSPWNMGPGVKILIMLNLLIWLFDITNVRRHLVGVDLQELFGLHYWEASTFNPFQFFSYMFLHDRASFLHVFFNMFNLWMFGNLMEQRWGTQRFLIFYFVCGIGGGILQQAAWSMNFVGKTTSELCIPLFGQDITSGGTVSRFNITGIGLIDSIDGLRDLIMGLPTCIGASGATFGVLVAFAMTFPNLPLYLMFIPIPIKAKYMVSGFIAIELFSTLIGRADGVSHLAHLGGVIFGILLIMLWRKSGEDNGPVY